MDSQFQYFAFISYSHKDEKFAENLQKRLSFYKLPHLLKKDNPSLPDSVSPIFRDKTNLTAGVLKNSLKEELDNSKFLIVLCSTSSSKSYWVNEEVKHFINIGRKDYIIPVIVEGEANSSDADNEAFCPALKGEEFGEEFLGIDIKPPAKKSPFTKFMRFIGIPLKSDTEEQGFIRIIAKLLELNFDDLWNWQRKEEKKRGIIRCTYIAAVIAVIICAMLVLWNARFRTTYKYYSDYVDKWGIPEGINQLNKEQISHRTYHYTFGYKAGKLRTVVCANFKEIPINESMIAPEHPIYQELEYNDKNGKLERIVCKDEENKIKMIYEHRADLNFTRVNLSEENKHTGYAGLEVDKFYTTYESGRVKGDISSFSYERNENGYITKQLFHKYHDSFEPACDFYGVYGYNFVLNDKGQNIEKWYLDPEGNILSKRDGVAGEYFIYDDYGNCIQKSFIDRNKNIILSNYGLAIQTNTYDEWGRLISCNYSDENRLPALINGYSEIQYDYDTNGNIIEQRYYKDDKLTNDINGVAIYKIKNNQDGFRISTSCFNAEGKRVRSSDSEWSKIDYILDDKNQLSEVYCYDENDNLMYSNSWRAAIVKIKYDKDTDNIEFLRYDEYNNQIIQNKEEEPGVILDKNGWIIESKVLDTQGNISTDQYGTSIYRYKYDERGNNIEISFHDADGKLILNSERIARCKYEYNNRAEMIAIKYFGMNNEPVLNSQGVASIRVKYDDNGHIIEKANYGKHDQLVLDEIYKWAITRYKYNSEGQLIEKSFFDQNNQPAITFSNGAYIKLIYDSNGLVIEERYYDLNDSLFENIMSFAIKRYKHDEKGNCTEITIYDKNNKLVNNSITGSARLTFEYDEYGNEIAEYDYDKDGNLVARDY